MLTLAWTQEHLGTPSQCIYTYLKHSCTQIYSLTYNVDSFHLLAGVTFSYIPSYHLTFYKCFYCLFLPMNLWDSKVQ